MEKNRNTILEDYEEALKELKRRHKIAKKNLRKMTAQVLKARLAEVNAALDDINPAKNWFDLSESVQRHVNELRREKIYLDGNVYGFGW